MIKKFTTNLHVDKKIVPLLSKSTYQKSFASALKELISNAYDADSLSVFIRMDKSLKNIEIEDDGNGMTQIEFERYLTIAGTKNPVELSRKYSRKKIGQFGVGFLSIFPYCEKLEIITTAENSDEVITAVIPTVDYTRPDKKGQTSNVEDIPITGNIISDKSQRLKHYTKIKLVNPTYNVEQYFTALDTSKRDSIHTLNPLEKFKWELQEDLPISYDPKKKSFGLIKYDEPIGISVFINDEIIYRNELQNEVLEQGVEIIGGFECPYIFTTSYKAIRPFEARGVKRRINNVGIGPRTDFELKRSRGFSRLHWIAGEIYYPDEIKTDLTISRDTFISSAVVDEINDVFAEKLKKWAYYVEDVAVAEKTIEQAVTNTKKGNNTPKEETIQENIKVLKEKGFKVINVKQSESNKHTKNPIQIDKSRRTVTVIETDEIVKDYIEVLGKKYEIIYTSEGFEDDEPCRFKNTRVIEINKNYPLFKSKTYGHLFKKLHIFLLMSSEKSTTSKSMYNNIMNEFIKEFEDFK